MRIGKTLQQTEPGMCLVRPTLTHLGTSHLRLLRQHLRPRRPALSAPGVGTLRSLGLPEDPEGILHLSHLHGTGLPDQAAGVGVPHPEHAAFASEYLNSLTWTRSRTHT